LLGINGMIRIQIIFVKGIVWMYVWPTVIKPMAR